MCEGLIDVNSTRILYCLSTVISLINFLINWGFDVIILQNIPNPLIINVDKNDRLLNGLNRHLLNMNVQYPVGEEQFKHHVPQSFYIPVFRHKNLDILLGLKDSIRSRTFSSHRDVSIPSNLQVPRNEYIMTAFRAAS
jgi:hypothetical protein